MRVLVTGAAGYIGSHVCKALKLSGATVIATDIVDLNHSYYDVVNYADLTNLDATKCMLSSFNSIDVFRSVLRKRVAIKQHKA